jgi:flagellar basal-body rod modification protein FlgD
MATTDPTSPTSIYDIIAKQQAASGSSGSGSGSNSSTQSGDDALASLSGDYTNFLTLLTTQLKNQDPLSPMDTAQFTQQLVQFSAVEQQINGNKKLDQLIGLQSTANAYGAVGFVGTTVSASTDDIPLQNGKSKFDYQIEHTSGTATLTIKNAAGNVVMLRQVDATVGTHPVEWDGTDYFGNQLPDGKYTVSVSYQGQSDGKSYEAPITSYGKVDSALISDGTVYLKMGDVSVPLSDVISITKPADTTSTDTGSDGTDTGSDGTDSGSDGTGETDTGSSS